MNYFIGLALQDKEITIFGDGKQLRNALYIEDCLSALTAAGAATDADGHVFFAVRNDHYSVSEIAEKITVVFNRGAVKYVPWPEGRKRVDVGDAVISNNKIKDILKWNPCTPIEKGLKHTFDYFKECCKEYLR